MHNWQSPWISPCSLQLYFQLCPYEAICFQPVYTQLHRDVKLLQLNRRRVSQTTLLLALRGLSQKSHLVFRNFELFNNENRETWWGWMDGYFLIYLLDQMNPRSLHHKFLQEQPLEMQLLQESDSNKYYMESS